MRFQTHFHGWHDQVAFGVTDHLDGSPSVGVLQELAGNTTLVAPNDVADVERVLGARGDVAAVMVEPIGSSSGAIPTPPEVLGALREITKKHGALLIFDEVVTGFRVSPGGAQALYGVIPDLTTMAKIVAGGMPGGAVGGRKDILDWLDYEAAAAAGRERISHQGTHNAHPVSAAAGIATLKIIRGSDACAKASATAATLRDGMNEVLEEEGVPWAIYGEHSFFHIHSNPQGHAIRPTAFDASTLTVDSLKGKNEAMLGKLRLAMLVNGVDLKGWRGGLVSAAHTQADVDLTLEAWRKSLRALKEEGELPRSTSASAAAVDGLKGAPEPLLELAVAAEQRGQLAHARPLLAAVDRLLDLARAFGCQHVTRELAEFIAQLRLFERLIEVAPVALARVRRLPAILERDRDARRTQPRRDGAHRGVFRHVHAMTQRRDGGIAQSSVVDRSVAGISLHHHHRRGVGQRIFRREIIRRVRIAHDRSETISGDVDALDVVGFRFELRRGPPEANRARDGSDCSTRRDGNSCA